ncbi:MAG: hypothetical protein M3Y59_15070, partial [Myxococcota bacterium]|nr:hypothetical protein [Myxococcota bacterium]
PKAGPLRLPVAVLFTGRELVVKFPNETASEQTVHLPRSFQLVAHPDQGGLVLRGNYGCAAKYVHQCHHSTPLTLPARSGAEARFQWGGETVRGITQNGWTPATVILSNPPSGQASTE